MHTIRTSDRYMHGEHEAQRKKNSASYLLTPMLVIGHMAGHVLDGDCRILRMRIRQLVVMRRKKTPAMLHTKE